MSSMFLGFLLAAAGIMTVVAARFASSRRQKKSQVGEPSSESAPAQPVEPGEKTRPGFRTRFQLALVNLVAANGLFLVFFNETATVMWENEALWMALVQLAVIVWKLLTLTGYGDGKWVLYVLVFVGGFLITTPKLLSDPMVLDTMVADVGAWKARTAFVLSKFGVSQVGRSMKIETPTQLPSASSPRLPSFLSDSSGEEPKEKKSAEPEQEVFEQNGVKSVEVTLDPTRWTSIKVLGEFKNGDLVLVELVSGVRDSLTLRIGGVPGGKCMPRWGVWQKIHTTDPSASGTGELWTNRKDVVVKVSRK